MENDVSDTNNENAEPKDIESKNLTVTSIEQVESSQCQHKGDSQASIPHQSQEDAATDDNKTVPEEKLPIPEVGTLKETVTFTLIFKKTKHSITWPSNETILSLKHHVQSLTKVAPAMQKVMLKGILDDKKTLKESGITNGVKVMLIGSKLQDVISVNTTVSEASTSALEESLRKREPLCKQKPHAKIIEKGIPDDVMPGYGNGQEPLSTTPLKGMVNKHGNKVRLMFKLEADQLWLGTKDRTQKLPLNSIKDVVAEKIDDYPGYHIIALQLGQTEQSRYWIYWVPSQYVEAIKDAILGKWQML